MGVDTKIKLITNPTIETLTTTLSKLPKFLNVEVSSFEEAGIKSYISRETNEQKEYFDEGYCRINFGYEFTNSDGKQEIENRSLFVVPNTYDKDDGEIPNIPEKYTYISMGYWGSNIDIANEICEAFSGFVIPNDCADSTKEDFFYMINSENNKIMTSKEEDLFNSLINMNAVDKLNIFKILNENSNAIKRYLN
jgi:hypothetical protein